MKIRKAYKIIAGILLLAIYFVVASIYTSRKYRELPCKDFNIEVDSTCSFLSKEIVLSTLQEEGIVIDSTVKVANVNFAEIEKIINNNVYVKESQAYSDFEGSIYLKVIQRVPMLRVITEDTVSFYIDEDLKKMPVCDHYTANVMVLSGHLKSECFNTSDTVNNYNVNNDENSLNISDICEFVKYIQSDELWSNQITQVYVTENNEIELVPLVGNHIILLGGLDDYKTKLNKLEAMYKKGFTFSGWDTYSLINLKFKNQVICKKRNNG